MILTRLLFKIAIVLFGLCSAEITLAQFSRTISGTVTLDEGVAEENYPVTVSVLEGSERIISDFQGGIRFVFEERDRKQTTVVIPQGQRTTGFRVPGVSNITLAYRVLIECDKCGVMTNTQYYTDGGTQFFGSSNATFRTSELPAFINVIIQTGFSVTGTINLAKGALAPRDLSFQILGATIESFRSRGFSSETITLSKGTSKVNYKIRGLRPDIGGSFRLVLRCANCQELYPPEVRLSSNFPLGQNVTGADFFLRESKPITPIINLLLDEKP